MATTTLNRPQAPTRPVSSGVRGARLLCTITTYLFVAGVVLQVFLAGVGLMVDGDQLAAHQAVGYLVLHLPYAILILAPFARLPRRLLATAALLALLATVHDVFVYVPVDGGAGFLRAFHPVNALALFWISTQLALGLRRLPR